MSERLDPEAWERHFAGILSQLDACRKKPGLWGGCPPDSDLDGSLSLMLRHELVQWRKLGGYELTDRGQRLLLSVERLRARNDLVATP